MYRSTYGLQPVIFLCFTSWKPRLEQYYSFRRDRRQREIVRAASRTVLYDLARYRVVGA